MAFKVNVGLMETDVAVGVCEDYGSHQVAAGDLNLFINVTPHHQMRHKSEIAKLRF